MPQPYKPRNAWTNALPDWAFRAIALYGSGYSTRDVARELGYSPSYVALVLQKLGVTRDRVEALILACPPTSKHWRSSRASARKLWMRTFGSIPRTVHVHHANGDYTDNRLENLVLMSASDHARLHHPASPVPRHLRPERQAYMKAYLRKWWQRKKEVAGAR